MLDKTGTITRGEPEVVAVEMADGFDVSELLRLAAGVERESEHPLAVAVVNEAQRRGLAAAAAESFAAVPGHGAVATVEGRTLAIGNDRLLEREGIALDGLAERAASLAEKVERWCTSRSMATPPVLSPLRTHPARRLRRPFVRCVSWGSGP